MFALTQFVMEEVPEDAFRIYCLDHGARYILTHFSQTDFITWLSSDNIRSSELVAKYLMTGMFYLQVLMARGDSLRFFNPLADFSIGKRDIRFSGAFQIMQGFTPRDFIFEVIRHEDLPTIWQQKVNEKIAPFVLQSYWEMYYRNMPVFPPHLSLNRRSNQTAVTVCCYLFQNQCGMRIITNNRLLF